MGSIFKAAKKVAKRISRPVSKITKGIAKGIARVGKSVMKGVAKINKKLGPLGMIAMSIAMPYALGGLSNLIGHGGMAAGQASGLMGSQNLFLRSIGQVGNAIRTGYQATTGAISNTMSTISKSISKGFQNFAGKFKGQNNIFSRISEGAKNLFKQSKATVNDWKGKMKFGKDWTGGSVEVAGWGGPAGGASTGGNYLGMGTRMTTEQLKALTFSDHGMMQSFNAEQMKGLMDGTFSPYSNQQLPMSGKLSTMDKIVQSNINNAYKGNMNTWTDGAKSAFNEYKTAAQYNGSYINDAEIGDIMSKGLETTGTSDGSWTHFDTSKSKDFSYSPTHDKYIFNGNDSFKVNGKSTLKNKTTEWLKKKVKSKTYDTLKKGLLDQDLKIEAPPINYAMMGAMHTGSTMGQDAKWSGTDLKGASQGSLLHGTFSAQQIDQINNYYRHMNI